MQEHISDADPQNRQTSFPKRAILLKTTYNGNFFPTGSMLTFEPDSLACLHKGTFP